jgi:hypothetical protein
VVSPWRASSGVRIVGLVGSSAFCIQVSFHTSEEKLRAGTRTGSPNDDRSEPYRLDDATCDRREGSAEIRDQIKRNTAVLHAESICWFMVRRLAHVLKAVELSVSRINAQS